MRRSIHILYTICAIGIIFLFLYICGNLKDAVYQARENNGFQYLRAYECNTIEDEDAPAGVRTEYVIRNLEIPEGGRSLVFYTIHQNVQVYIGEELVYRLEPSEDNLFGKTPGNTWNTVPIYEKDAGKEIRILLVPVYESSIDIVPEFYFGSGVSIWRSVIEKDFMTVLLSLLAFLLGSVFIIFSIFSQHIFRKRSTGEDGSLFMMGMFSVNIGIWKFADVETAALLFPHSIALTYIPFLTLMMVVVPFVLYIKEMFAEDKKIWYVPCFASIAVIISSVVLQITGLADLRQTLWSNHLVMVLVLVVGIAMLFRELRLVGWNNRLKILVICMGSCLVGTVVDIGIYYISKGATMTVMGMLGFLVYIIVLGVGSVRRARKLMSIGMKARHYEQMAYHDQLTGLYNRAAYADYVEHSDHKQEKCTLVMFDLNDLKHCNDTWGHDQGDSYIINSAKLIHDVFGNIGKCYRMGGDEFCAVLKEVSVGKCQALVRKLKEREEAWNRQNEEKFEIQIACGYARYDAEQDYDLGDTLRRADRMMYQEKYAMKKEE